MRNPGKLVSWAFVGSLIVGTGGAIAGAASPITHVRDDAADGDESELVELAELEASAASRALASFHPRYGAWDSEHAETKRTPLYGKDYLPASLASPRRSRRPEGPLPATSREELVRALGGMDPDSLAELDVAMRWNAPVLTFVEFFRGKGRKLIKRWVARSGRYFPMMEREFGEAGLPLDLRYISFIESGLNPKALSSASASGLWQFMRVTGSAYGLVSDYWIDDRRIPERSTAAAARHLAALHDRFGSWELTLAAYNCGGGLLSAAIRKYGTNDFWELSRYGALPNQTRLYVPKFYAVAIVAKNLAALGFEPIEREPELAYELGHVPGSISMDAIARAAGVPVAVIMELNPELKRCCTPHDRTDYRIRLPVGTARKYAEGIAKRWPRSKLEFVHHVVKLGDTIKGIAKRYGTSVKRIRSMNTVRRDADLKPGAVLVVPRKAGLPPVRLAKADTGTKSDAVPVVAFVPETVFRYPDRVVAYYVVRPSDDLDGIASTLGVTPEEIVLWNGLDPEAELMTRMVLRLYLEKGAGDVALLVDPKTVKVLARGSDPYMKAVRGRSIPLPSGLHYAGPGAPGGSRYAVRKGDSLWTIARRFGVTVGALKSANGLHGKDPLLSIGRALIIPGTSRSSGAKKAKKKK